MISSSQFEVRNTVSTDLARLSALDHTINTDYVLQLDFRHDAIQTEMTLREVRIPRTIRVTHPRPANELPDTWHLRPMLSAMIGMEAIAYIRFTDAFVPHAVWITDVVVGKPYRGLGVARKLITAAESWAIQRGLRKAMIEVQSKNSPGVRMIQKLGFEFCGYNDQYYYTKDIALFFARTI